MQVSAKAFFLMRCFSGILTGHRRIIWQTSMFSAGVGSDVAVPATPVQQAERMIAHPSSFMIRCAICRMQLCVVNDRRSSVAPRSAALAEVQQHVVCGRIA